MEVSSFLITQMQKLLSKYNFDAALLGWLEVKKRHDMFAKVFKRRNAQVTCLESLDNQNRIRYQMCTQVQRIQVTRAAVKKNLGILWSGCP